MKLRELINLLEELSENGKNDDMGVYIDEGWSVKDAYITSYEYIELKTYSV